MRRLAAGGPRRLLLVDVTDPPDGTNLQPVGTALLGDVGQLMGQQCPPGRRAETGCVGSEVDIVAAGEGDRPQILNCTPCRGILVEPYPGQVGPGIGLEPSKDRRLQRLPTGLTRQQPVAPSFVERSDRTSGGVPSICPHVPTPHVPIMSTHDLAPLSARCLIDPACGIAGNPNVRSIARSRSPPVREHAVRLPRRLESHLQHRLDR